MNEVTELWLQAGFLNGIQSLLRIRDEDEDSGVEAGKEALLQLENRLPLRPNESIVSADISEDQRGVCVRTDSDTYTLMPRGAYPFGKIVVVGDRPPSIASTMLKPRLR